MFLMIDDETRSYWNHVTGESVHGTMAGARLEAWGVEITTAEAEIARSDSTTISRSHPGLRGRLVSWLAAARGPERIGIPFFFRRTMAAADLRLPERCRGLAVVVAGRARFYRVAALERGVVDLWGGRELTLGLGPTDRMPFARWEDGSRPFQLLMRWYGFAYTYPGGAIHRGGGDPGEASQPTSSWR